MTMIPRHPAPRQARRPPRHPRQATPLPLHPSPQTRMTPSPFRLVIRSRCCLRREIPLKLARPTPVVSPRLPTPKNGLAAIMTAWNISLCRAPMPTWADCSPSTMSCPTTTSSSQAAITPPRRPQTRRHLRCRASAFRWWKSPRAATANGR